MRPIAHEGRLAKLATHDFGPLIPAGRPLVCEEDGEQFLCTLAPAEAHERPHGAQLIGGVIVPEGFPVPPCRKRLPVSLERCEQQILRQVGLLPSGGESNRR
jgi:hypothetical protein